MAEQEKIDDIINLLDNFVSTGGGHMNITVDNPEEIQNVQIDTYKSTDCSTGNMACNIPTLHQGIDDEE